jgi:probable rRNA maturation factor
MVIVESQVEPMPVPAGLVEAAARETLSQQDAVGELTVVLSDDAQLRQLNHQYLGIDATTDVLSFPEAETDPDTGETYLGDVIISVTQAQVQARENGHPLESELQLLVVHGVLHLLGHDHARSEDRTRMWSAQAEVLKRLGLQGITFPE